jgi:hypothetical protein
MNYGKTPRFVGDLPSSLSHADLGLFPGTKPLGKPLLGCASYQGVFGSTKALGLALFQSLLERDFQTILCADPRIKTYAVQSHQLKYWTPTANGTFIERLYTPDIVVLLHDGRRLVTEVKSLAFVKQKYWLSRESHIRNAYARDHAIPFLVITERAIRVQPRLSNFEVMLRLGSRMNDRAAVTAVRDALILTHSHARVGDLCDLAVLSNGRLHRAYAAVMHLALHGELVLDLDKPLSLSTRVIRRSSEELNSRRGTGYHVG